MKERGPIIRLLPFWLFVFLFKFGAGLHYTLLPVLGGRVMPIWAVGLVIGAASFLQLIFDVPAGVLLDRFGYVRILRIATEIFLVGALVLVLGLSLPTFLITVFLGFLGWLFFGPGIAAYTLVNAEKGKGGRYMGLLHSFSSLGVVYATIGMVFITNQSYQLMGVVIALLLIASTAALLFTRSDKTSVKEVSYNWKNYHIKQNYFHQTIATIKYLNPAALMLAIQNFVSSLFYGIIWFTVPLVIAHQASSGVLGIGLGMFDLAIVVLGAVLGKYADRTDKKKMIFLGLFIFATSAVLLGFNLNILFILFGFLATAGDEMSLTSLWSWYERISKKHNEDGKVSGVITLFEDMGWTIGPIVAGFLYVLIGPSVTIIIAALPLVLFMLFSVIFLHGKTLPPGSLGGAVPDRPNRLRYKS